MTALTADERLRVLAALEAAWTKDHVALEILAATGAGERSLAEAVAAYAEETMRTLLAATTELHDGSTPAEVDAAAQRLASDPGARMTHLWVHTLSLWAQEPASVRALEGMCRALLTAILSYTGDGGPDDVLPLLAQLRAAVLARS